MKDACDHTEEQWNGLIPLLDDDSVVVRQGLLEHFSKNEEQAHPFLMGISQGKDPYLAKHAQEIIDCLGWVDGPGDFLRFIRSMRYEMETGWFLLDRVVYPHFKSHDYAMLLDQMADRVRELMVTPSRARQTCAILNRVIFHEFEFRGAGQNFDHPDNSILHRVLDTRQGLPIVLCIIYILVARRIGFDLEPIGAPGRFLVGCFEEKHPFYIDCWSGGRLIDLEQMEIHLGDVPLENAGSYLLPVTVSESLARGCRNLVGQYAKSGDDVRSKLFLSFVTEFERIQQEAPNA